MNILKYNKMDNKMDDKMDDKIEQNIECELINDIAQKYNLNFLVDKYIPKNVSDIFDNEISDLDNSWKNSIPSKCFFHKEIFKKLDKINNDDGMPHMIFYGNPGSGKKTMINLFLEMIFDDSIYKLNNSKYIVISSGNIENEVIVKQSDHHIIIEPNNNNFDRYLIQDIVKEYARRYPLCIFENSRNFKMVQINNLDNLSYYAQTSLRRTIEKYSKTCRFIMWCYSLSKVIEPLRSRCICIHVPTQTNDELVQWAFNIASIEKIKLTFPILNYIIETSNGNLKDILWKLDLYKYCNKVQNGYQKSLNNLISEIITSGDIQTIRDYIYKMMITNISSNIIIKDILNIILEKLDNFNNSKEKALKIINYASNYEYRLSKGRRDIIHIEAFIINVINTLNE
jgi:replication factor C subunit 3/5